MLDWYVSQPRTKDEKKYSLEQLRWKKAFIACNIKDTPYTIDTLQDVEKMNHVPETEQASTTAQ
jgi:CMP-2-keto-3-deoxyoctulosonic acid synthetase